MTMAEIQKDSRENTTGINLKPCLDFIDYERERRKRGDVRSEAEIMISFRALQKKRKESAK